MAIFGVSTSGGMRWWWPVPIILVPLLIGLLPWLTIRYRITETRLERRSGLINKQEVTAPSIGCAASTSRARWCTGSSA